GEQLENVDIACVDASQRTLEGVVANRASVPVSGAFISVPGLAGVSARANTEGFFHLSGLPDRVFTLQVEHEDYCTASLEVDGQNERANVTLNRHASVAGRVVNATTRQAVKSFSITPGAPAFFNADDGRFELNGLCPETASLQVSAKGFVKQSVEVTLIAEENLRDLEIALEPGVRVDGVVTTASGTGIPGATIFVDNFPSQPSFATGVITQADGSFTLTDLPPSPAPIFAWKEGFALARAFSPAGGGALRLVLLPGGTLAGKVMVNGKPMQVFQVTVEIFDEGVTLITGDVHDDSTYDVNGLPPGEVLAHIWSAEMVETAGAYRLTSRGRTTVRTVNIAAGETTTLDVNFPPATSVVEGTVATADDVAGQFMATLQVDTVEGQEQFSVQGDTEQGFSFAGVPAGDAALTVTLLPAMEEQREIAFTLQEGEVRQVQVDLVPAELTPE
ncbi:MAG: carboxypeptidase regulatory-like domain-containing protein, partial [Candidatus Hydrogenedentes bacterium]|nr:carboxypeptidase regulatory-like domain-containing protein [Candidatus Hydrogenedentota bacterium]